MIEPRQNIQQKRFLSVSGNRCGSTWLGFMLNSLSDVRMEFEMQWTAEELSDLHVSMKQNGFELEKMFGSISEDSPVVGSKIVFPPQNVVLPEESDVFSSLLGNEVSIIHIGRPYIESYLSKLRNGGHLRNIDGKRPPEKSKVWLVNALEESVFQEGAMINLPIDEVEQDLRRRYENDQFNASLRNGKRPYMHVEYREISARFGDIASFVGSEASAVEIDQAIKHPPTKKLPPVDYESFIKNYDELKALSQIYETKRKELFL